jgi:hypothetical protein
MVISNCINFLNFACLRFLALRQYASNASCWRDGRREEHGCAVDVEEDGEACLLDPHRDLGPHACADLAWGSYGSGAAQLALALAADGLGDDARALRIH